jgi:hypothetical protein
MGVGHFGPQVLLVKVERLGLCMGGGERWGVDQWVCAQCFELGKPGIAKVVVEYSLE